MSLAAGPTFVGDPIIDDDAHASALSRAAQMEEDAADDALADALKQDGPKALKEAIALLVKAARRWSRSNPSAVWGRSNPSAVERVRKKAYDANEEYKVRSNGDTFGIPGPGKRWIS